MEAFTDAITNVQKRKEKVELKHRGRENQWIF